MRGRTLDCYEVLGVPRRADAETIRKAYRALARKYHPDVCDDPQAERKFREVRAAYEVLSTTRSRLLYDALGLAGTRPGDGARHAFATSRSGPTFVELPRRQPLPNHEEERPLEVAVDRASARRGTVRRVRLTASATCDECGGRGAAEQEGVSACGACGGSGSVQERPVFDSGPALAIHPCGECRGTGRHARPCARCGGSGKARVERSLRVRIPRGAKDGDRVTAFGRMEPDVVASLGGGAEEVVVRILALPDLRLIRYASAGGLGLALVFLVVVLRMVV